VVAVTRTATAIREGRFWVVDVPGVGVTQGRSVREARVMAADLVEAMTGNAEEVEVQFELPDEVREVVEHARTTSAEAQRLSSVAAEEYRQAVRELVTGRGMSKADVAALLQVSQQRVSQLAP
jgi:ribosome-binding protein aMBF1 (putative translation factor)